MKTISIFDNRINAEVVFAPGHFTASCVEVTADLGPKRMPVKALLVVFLHGEMTRRGTFFLN